MHWLILLASAVLEAVWATALGMSDGLSRPLPAAVFFIAGTLSMAGLGYAMRAIPIGTAYAVWTGTGAALTVSYAMLFGGEPSSLWKLLFLAGIIGCVIGLKLVDARQASPPPAGEDAPKPGEVEARES